MAQNRKQLMEDRYRITQIQHMLYKSSKSIPNSLYDSIKGDLDEASMILDDKINNKMGD